MFFFKQKTAYEMRISDWSSDVCSSYLSIFIRNAVQLFFGQFLHKLGLVGKALLSLTEQVHRDRPALRLIGIASDEKNRTAGGVHLLRGEHPPDGVGVTIRRLADLDLLVVILGEGERARRLKRHLVLGDQVDQRGCERGKAKHLVDEADCLTEPGCDFLGVHASVAQCRKGADAVGGRSEEHTSE